MIRMEVACLLVLLFIAATYFSAKRIKTPIHTTFSALLIVGIINIILDAITVYTVNHLATVPGWANEILHRFFLGSMCAIFYIVYRYTVLLTEDESNRYFPMSRFSRMVLILCLIGTFTFPLIYVETERGNYSYGLAVHVLYLTIAIYLVLIVVALVKHWKNIHPKKKMPICLAFSIELLVAGYQGTFPWSLVSGMGITLIILALYMTIESPDSLLIEQLRTEKIKVEQATQAKSLFVSNMSHEIRTPMNAIVGMTDILLRSDMTSQQKSYLYNIKNSGNALLAIINDILDFSKIESGKMELVEDSYEPMSMLSDIGMIILNRIGEKPIELLFDIDKELPGKLYGDANRIRQIIINLMNNAAKFTEEGFVKLTIHAKWISEKEIELAVNVQDSGQGIREEDMDKLFGAFQQVDTKKNRNQEGTGLGLAICSQLVELMGGTIGVKSEYGTGSEFYFTIRQKVENHTAAAALKYEDDRQLPVIGASIQNQFVLEGIRQLAEAYGLAFRYEDDIDWQGEEKPEKYPEYFFVDEITYENGREQLHRMQEEGVTICVLQNPMRYNFHDTDIKVINKPLYSLSFCRLLNKEDLMVEDAAEDREYFTAPEAKVLIVDDNEMNLKVAKGLLEPLQLQIDVAESGMQALEMIQLKQYHIVFMDHMMPVMDGVETTRRIRSMGEEYYRKLPVIALTANVLMDAQEEFHKAGMNDFVAKPIEFHQICSVIRKWLPDELIKGAKNPLQETEQTDLPQIEGLDVSEGVKNSGNKELFTSLLGDFYKLIDRKASKIEKCLADGMLKDYTIEVHALKNTARMIGAMKLSEWCYRLEQLGNEQNKEILEKETPGAMELYRSYKPILKPYGMAQEQEKKEVPAEEIIELLTTMKDATDNFDLDTVDATMKALEQCQLPQDCIPMLEDLRAYVADVAMEEILTTVDAMMHKIQE